MCCKAFSVQKKDILNDQKMNAHCQKGRREGVEKRGVLAYGKRQKEEKKSGI